MRFSSAILGRDGSAAEVRILDLRGAEALGRDLIEPQVGATKAGSWVVERIAVGVS